MFMGGFMSDMTGTKAMALEDYCRRRGQAFLRFDYQGHGQSSGRFEDGTIGTWTDDALFCFDRLTQGPQVLVGSSMGGWIMLLVALKRQARLKGLVGIAAAPDFTEDLMWQTMMPVERETLLRDGVLEQPSAYSDEPYRVTLRLIEEGRRHLLLRDRIPLALPVRLLHGMKDADVPWETSMRIAERLDGPDVVVSLVKAGDHRLSTPDDLERLCSAVGGLIGG
ncbi:MAG: alpha/beta hydrolase [Alphaproteobacteria bacterium]|nr:alpha/beta hydrolase [Alphaproteobacteria bacterium]